MTFDATKEYGNTLDSTGFASGKEYIDAVLADAGNTLPPNTEFSFISWTDEATNTRHCGWVYNLLNPRPQQKLFNPLKTALKT